MCFKDFWFFNFLPCYQAFGQRESNQKTLQNNFYSETKKLHGQAGILHFF